MLQEDFRQQRGAEQLRLKDSADERTVKMGFEQEGIVPFVRMDSDAGDFDSGLFQHVGKEGLFFRVEADVRVDAEDEVALVSTALKE